MGKRLQGDCSIHIINLIKEILLKTVIEKIRNNLESIKRKVLPNPRRTKKQAFLHLIIQNYSELLIILERVHSQKEEMKSIRVKQSKWKEVGVITDPKKIKLIWRYHELVDSLKVDIKSLYNWTHQIENILGEYKNSIDLAELRRISRIRHKFITHVSESSFIKNRRLNHEGLRTDAEFENIQIIFRDFFDKSIYPKIKKVVKACKIYMPDLNRESNYQEQMQIIYRDLDKIKDRRVSLSANNLIESYGIFTESPSKIASELLKVLLKYRRIKRI